MIPPVLIATAAGVNAPIVQLLKANVRDAESCEGDLLAQIAATKAVMGIPDEAFWVPEDVLEHMRAAGTRGRALVDGARPIKLHGKIVPVLAHVAKIDSMSAHADSGEIMRWLSGFTRAPRMTYLVHGDPVALSALSDRLTRELHWPVHVARHLERVSV